jgi:protein tyrosine phosphatase (PTP) superfamily phosphohydrolase (DUF442 family)
LDAGHFLSVNAMFPSRSTSPDWKKKPGFESLKVLLAFVVSLILLSVIGCNSDLESKTRSTASAAQSPNVAGSLAVADAEKKQAHHDSGETHALHNVMQACDGVYSGGQPETDEAFAELARMGVKTIISVDGAKPNLEAARKHGLQYVHIPMGYDGVPQPATLAIVRVMKERPGSFFFHCHHGKHRGPAAAAIAGMCSGKLAVAQAIEYLGKAGTGQEYKGLWRDVERFQMPPADAKLPDLAETAEVASLAAAMADIDRIYDRLKLCEQAKWTALPNHADVSPQQEALLLKEAFREPARHLPDEDTEKLQAGLVAAEKLSETLEMTLKQNKPEEATATLANLTTACKACHTKFRN